MNIIPDKIAKLIEPPKQFTSAYDAGFDAGKNKPNTNNCHFGWFSSKESSDEWSRGYKAAGGDKR